MTDGEDREPDEPEDKGEEGDRGEEGQGGAEAQEGREDPRRPTPVRQTLPPARPAPVRQRTPTGEDEDDDPERPTPVRQAMEAEREEPPPVEAPSLRFFREDEEWIVRVEGRTRSGRREDAGAPLLLLSFARAEDPDRRLREAVGIGRSLETLTPGELGRLLDASRPYREEWEGSELFPETRRDRSSGR